MAIYFTYGIVNFHVTLSILGTCIFFLIRAFIRRIENTKGRIKVHLKLFRLLDLDHVAIGLQNRVEMLTSAKDVE